MPNSANAAVTPGRWAIFAVVSSIFLLITGATFSSLGVVLPSMIADLSWSWSQAGAGFSLFALMVGLASNLPAWTLRRFGIRATYGTGGALMVSGFALLALTQDFTQYLAAATLLGLGFASCATVPAVYLLNGWMPERRSAAIGAFMTIGGLGAVAGPLAADAVLAATDSWRAYWWGVTAAMLAIVALAVAVVENPPEHAARAQAASAADEEPHSAQVYRTAIEWRFREAIRTSQFWVISAAMTATLLCMLTANSWAVTHMGTLGVPAHVATRVLGILGVVSALSRAVGGALATRVDPRWLLVAALAGDAIGMAALSVADGWVPFIVFAVAEGVGFGLCFLATALLLVNYFGPADNPEIYGTYNLITTAAMIGPAVSGFIADHSGGFAGVFRGYVAVMLVMVVITAAMRPPGVPAARA